MAEVIVQEESLVTVADAIREKTGGTEALVFPTGFAEAIAAIQAGGIQGYQIVSGFYTPTENVTSRVTVYTTKELGYSSPVIDMKDRCVGLVFVVPNAGAVSYPTPILQSECFGKDSGYNAKALGSGSTSSLGRVLALVKIESKYGIAVRILCNETYPLVAGQTYAWMLLVPNDIAI